MTAPRIAKLEALDNFSLAVTWKDGQSVTVNLSGVIAEVRALADLADPDLFATARIVAYGRGVEWDNGADFSADSLAAMAEEQARVFTGDDFKRWQEDMGLSIREAAGLFEVDPSTIKNYRAAGDRPLKAMVRFACAGLRDDDDMRRALRRPRRAGRPASRKHPAGH